MKIGVCGTGTVASWCSDIICQLGDPNIELYACATSPGFDCTEFAEKYGFKKISASFDALMQDPEVELVYIAVPNNFHYDLCMKAIAYGKNLVCEKPFSVHEEECKKILDAAHEKGVFVSEALWPTFLPAHQNAKAEIAAGTIGDVKSMNIVMLGNVMFLERVKHLETGGGELLDEGPYTLGCMTMYLGTDIVSVTSKTRKLDTGVDAEDEIDITYADGCTVHIHQAMDCSEEESNEHVEILGTKGKIVMNAVANPKEVKVLDLQGNLIKEIDVPTQIAFRGMPPVSSYEHEWIGYAKALQEGRKECEEIPNATTLAISRIMNVVFRNAGIEFPF